MHGDWLLIPCMYAVRLMQLYDLKVSKSVALLGCAPPAADDYYRAISIINLVEYSIGPNDIPLTEKVCYKSCRIACINSCFLLMTHAHSF